ncbi:MAG: hypothetical protein A4E35_02121 [Methanoregula sp. PtaU1.Bin051]|nr:MAG: hypothetical protein A4E35_02121 [Methanoregula sp. PtaU1.Bin051]
MSLAALRETIDLLTTRPLLWLPGLACGLLAALIWIVFYVSGAFFAGRLLFFFLLVAIFFVAATYVSIRDEKPTVADMARGAKDYYFRLLTPTLVIAFGIVLVFVLVILTLAMFGTQPDYGILTFLTFGIVLPTVMLTYFYDCAVVLEERKVFESLQRSMEIVTANLFSILLFYISCFIIFCVTGFAFFVAWTAALADRLEPITHYNDTQLAAFTIDQLVPLIGYEGFIVTAVCIFAAVAILVPLLLTYKACYFKIVAGTTVPIQQMIGEYDSKGRWYKY